MTERKSRSTDAIPHTSGEPWWVTFLMGCLFFWLVVPASLTGELSNDDHQKDQPK